MVMWSNAGVKPCVVVFLGERGGSEMGVCIH